MPIKSADTLKPNGSFAVAEAEDITIKTTSGGEEWLPDYLASLKGDDAYKAYTDQKIADLVNGAPETLDTLKEIADELKKNETALAAITDAVQNHTHDLADASKPGFMSVIDFARVADFAMGVDLWGDDFYNFVYTVRQSDNLFRSYFSRLGHYSDYLKKFNESIGKSSSDT